MINGKVIETAAPSTSACPGCQPPHSLYLPDGIGGVDGCTYDFMRDVELHPSPRSLGLLTRGVLAARRRTTRPLPSCRTPGSPRPGTPAPATASTADGRVLIPALAATGLATALPDDPHRGARAAAGSRQPRQRTHQHRHPHRAGRHRSGWPAGTTTWRCWHAVNTVSDRDVRGYLLYERRCWKALPTAHQSLRAAQRRRPGLPDSIQVNDEVRVHAAPATHRRSRAAGALFKLGGGDWPPGPGRRVAPRKASSKAPRSCCCRTTSWATTPRAMRRPPTAAAHVGGLRRDRGARSARRWS
jgi:iron complex outermembrane receptor protein